MTFWYLIELKNKVKKIYSKVYTNILYFNYQNIRALKTKICAPLSLN